MSQLELALRGCLRTVLIHGPPLGDNPPCGRQPRMIVGPQASQPSDLRAIMACVSPIYPGMSVRYKSRIHAVAAVIRTCAALKCMLNRWLTRVMAVNPTVARKGRPVRWMDCFTLHVCPILRCGIRPDCQLALTRERERRLLRQFHFRFSGTKVYRTQYGGAGLVTWGVWLARPWPNHIAAPKRPLGLYSGLESGSPTEETTAVCMDELCLLVWERFGETVDPARILQGIVTKTMLAIERDAMLPHDRELPAKALREQK